MTTHRTRTVAAGLVATLALAACSATGSGGGGGEDADVLRVVTHDSFTLSEGLLTAFEERTGYTVEQITPGDGGALVNQLVLTRDNPLGDVVYGIDNSFAARAAEEGVLQPYRSPDAVRTAMEDSLTAVDFGDVCVNVDHEWFREQGIPEPQTLEDLTDPTYADLLVVTNPATSSPGLAFLLATVGAFGEDGWEQYWRDLRANGVRVVEGWSDAYYVDFSGSEGAGPRPLVLSYSSSPAAEVPADGSEPRTGALLETCFRQTEYAGVLAGAENVEGAQEFVDFLLSPEVQADIPGSMFMYPVLDGVGLPQEWADHAPVSPAPHEVEPQAITDNRDRWIETWTEIVVG
ncbi:thiamine ABC transporter substrate-binding protein [Oceanitalea stevensii]|uniref:Thiamine ABC transporter substrate-binding protein n=1 Tax=Oceanitalea stevensii TaxID=2763072 RepID=A0ABR8Z1E7_9MICO|nr:thiamine ABC transporter substrate-binding protein [Oceanitalea stevensii]MBD8062149.1 thiamine ABC transporter substrate-binding protein [Oceanitalea stevensii]